MKYEFEKLTRLISQLNSSLVLLKELSSIDAENFKKDIHKVSSAKYNLITAVSSVMDIGTHIISKNAYRAPESYKDIFSVMAESGLLPQNFSNTLVDMVQYRDHLIELNNNVETETIYSILKNNLKDFDEFRLNLNEILK